MGNEMEWMLEQLGELIHLYETDVIYQKRFHMYESYIEFIWYNTMSNVMARTIFKWNELWTIYEI